MFFSRNCETGPTENGFRLLGVRCSSFSQFIPTGLKSGLRSDLSVVAEFLDLRLLTAQFAEVVQLGTTDVTARNNLDLLENWTVYWEGTLYAYLEGDLTNGEGLANTVARATDYCALENLNTAAVTFDDVYVNLYGVTNTESWDVAAQVGSIYNVKNVHFLDHFCRGTQVYDNIFIGIGTLRTPLRQCSN